jgi:hypothetical protein
MGDKAGLGTRARAEHLTAGGRMILIHTSSVQGKVGLVLLGRAPIAEPYPHAQRRPVRRSDHQAGDGGNQ